MYFSILKGLEQSSNAFDGHLREARSGEAAIWPSRHEKATRDDKMLPPLNYKHSRQPIHNVLPFASSSAAPQNTTWSIFKLNTLADSPLYFDEESTMSPSFSRFCFISFAPLHPFHAKYPLICNANRISLKWYFFFFSLSSKNEKKRQSCFFLSKAFSQSLCYIFRLRRTYSAQLSRYYRVINFDLPSLRVLSGLWIEVNTVRQKPSLIVKAQRNISPLDLSLPYLYSFSFSVTCTHKPLSFWPSPW